MQSNKSQRRIVFIKREFQGRFIAKVLSLIVVVAAVSAVLIYLLVGGDLEAKSNSAHLDIGQVLDRLALTVVLCAGVAAIGAGALAIHVVVHATHRIAGPLYRFETICRQVGTGNLDGITHLREHDELQDLSVAFGEMVGGLRQRRDQRLEKLRALESALGSAGGDTDAARAAIARLKELA